MEEENRVVEQEQQEQQGGLTPNCKNALTAFILAVIGAVTSAAIVGFVLGIIALSFLKKIDGEVERQPFRGFSKAVKPIAIVAIIFSALALIGWLIYFFWFIFVVVLAINEAAAQVALFVF